MKAPCSQADISRFKSLTFSSYLGKEFIVVTLSFAKRLERGKLGGVC
jgi:hypothetical protein